MLTLTFAHEIWAHRLPAGAKLAALALASTGLFAATGPAILAAAACTAALLTASGGRAFARAALRPLRMLWPFVLIVALWHLWRGDPAGIAIILRMLTAVALANFVTMTTRLSDMIAVLEGLARPLSRWLPPQRLALAIALTIRFVPVLLLRAETLADAYRARAAHAPRWRILPSLALSALDDSARIAEALRARGGID